eukprot:CAMPEP_0195579842 /NCGR_PEP_ID=MMETSP0814-20130614/16288_1 /TAXON_ID=97485 /ORGANISM="Prymnesium parvum, Strain Texoma1" /LENGTH=62 /DNA_ID=CAMNT_0040716753 /DNA_START=170 /DNA_END=354 /DNA_ORIENTATION=+
MAQNSAVQLSCRMAVHSTEQLGCTNQLHALKGRRVPLCEMAHTDSREYRCAQQLVKYGMRAA